MSSGASSSGERDIIVYYSQRKVPNPFGDGAISKKIIGESGGHFYFKVDSDAGLTDEKISQVIGKIESVKPHCVPSDKGGGESYYARVGKPVLSGGDVTIFQTYQDIFLDDYVERLKGSTSNKRGNLFEMIYHAGLKSATTEDIYNYLTEREDCGPEVAYDFIMGRETNHYDEILDLLSSVSWCDKAETRDHVPLENYGCKKKELTAMYHTNQDFYNTQLHKGVLMTSGKISSKEWNFTKALYFLACWRKTFDRFSDWKDNYKVQFLNRVADELYRGDFGMRGRGRVRTEFRGLETTLGPVYRNLKIKLEGKYPADHTFKAIINDCEVSLDFWSHYSSSIYHTSLDYVSVIMKHAEQIYSRALEPETAPDVTHQLLGEVFWWICRAKPWYLGDPSIAEMLIRSAWAAKYDEVLPGWREGMIPWEEVILEEDPQKFGENFHLLFTGTRCALARGPAAASSSGSVSSDEELESLEKLMTHSPEIDEMKFSNSELLRQTLALKPSDAIENLKIIFEVYKIYSFCDSIARSNNQIMDVKDFRKIVTFDEILSLKNELSEWCKKSHIEFIGLTDQKLTGLPDEIVLLTKLKTLDLSDLPGIKELPEKLIELSSLEELYIDEKLNDNPVVVKLKEKGIRVFNEKSAKFKEQFPSFPW